MKKPVFILNILLALVVVILDVFYIINGGLLLKSITSLFFVLIGAVNLVYSILKFRSNYAFFTNKSK